MLKYTPEFNYTEKAMGPARLLAFKLGARTALPPAQFVEVFPKPPRPRPDSESDIKKGRALFEARGCEMCHGADAKLTLETKPDATPGEHKLTLQAELKLNGQTIKVDQTLVLKVAAVEKPKAAK